MVEDERDAADLAELDLTIKATDQEIEAMALRLDRESPQAAEEAIRVIIEAVSKETL